LIFNIAALPLSTTYYIGPDIPLQGKKQQFSVTTATCFLSTTQIFRCLCNACVEENQTLWNSYLQLWYSTDLNHNTAGAEWSSCLALWPAPCGNLSSSMCV